MAKVTKNERDDHDDIIAEIRRGRDDHAQQFGYDIDAIFDDVKGREMKSGRVILSFPPKRPRRARKIA